MLPKSIYAEAVSYIRNHWDELLRLAVSIKEGTVTASLMLRKLGSYPRQNGLAVALRDILTPGAMWFGWSGRLSSSPAVQPALVRRAGDA